MTDQDTTFDSSSPVQPAETPVQRRTRLIDAKIAAIKAENEAIRSIPDTVPFEEVSSRTRRFYRTLNGLSTERSPE